MAVRYGEKHRGCAIICGAAPSLFEDLEKAKSLRPDATILGVNNVSPLVPEVTHIWTQHADHAEMFKEKAGRQIFVHSRPRQFNNGAGIWKLPVPDHKWAFVDYVWPDLSWVSGSSGVAGALWAKHGMGFDEVIMVGITLSNASRKYVGAYPSKPTKNDNNFAEDTQVDHWLRILKNIQLDGKTEGIYSMSGATRKVLGEPC